MLSQANQADGGGSRLDSERDSTLLNSCMISILDTLMVLFLIPQNNQGILLEDGCLTYTELVTVHSGY